jgi:hypothetical protein
LALGGTFGEGQIKDKPAVVRKIKNDKSLQNVGTLYWAKNHAYRGLTDNIMTLFLR